MATPVSIWVPVVIIFCGQVSLINTRSLLDPTTPEGVEFFLEYFGYTEWGSRTALTDDERTAAISKYQELYGLPVTGIADEATTNLMGQNRCDVPDFSSGRFARYEVYGTRWTSNLRWRLNSTHPNVPVNEAERVMTESVQEWQNWMSTISISKSTDEFSEIIINYDVPDAAGEHGDGYPFGANTLAHAFYPTSHPLGGDMHYNMFKAFSTMEPPSSTTYSLKHITVHELGHALGMKHSFVSGSIMSAYVSLGYAYRGLQHDDKAGILLLYGPCNLSPCQNGGTCTHNTVTRYTCTCSPSYTGTNCETVDHCTTSAPCKNGATCSNTQGGYACSCAPNYTGTNCDSVLSCTTTPCQNGGTCTNNVGGGYTCSCPSTHTGTNCDSVLPCTNSPCQNGGTCSNNNGGGYTCQCSSSFTGTNCDSALPCTTTPCQNGGTCTNNVGGGYTCNCPSTHTGTNCDSGHQFISSSTGSRPWHLLTSIISCLSFAILVFFVYKH